MADLDSDTVGSAACTPISVRPLRKLVPKPAGGDHDSWRKADHGNEPMPLQNRPMEINTVQQVPALGMHTATVPNAHSPNLKRKKNEAISMRPHQSMKRLRAGELSTSADRISCTDQVNRKGLSAVRHHAQGKGRNQAREVLLSTPPSIPLTGFAPLAGSTRSSPRSGVGFQDDDRLRGLGTTCENRTHPMDIGSWGLDFFAPLDSSAATSEATIPSVQLSSSKPSLVGGY